MMIPEVDKSDLSTYFLSYGDVDSVKKEVKYPNRWLYENEVYGIPITVVGRGVLYNKKVFKEAGITELPKTPDEFITDLKAVKDKTDAIPLYTNYAAGWTMGAWDDYTGITATRNSFIQKIRSLTREMEQALTTFTRSFTMQLQTDLLRMATQQQTGRAARVC